MAQLTDDCFAFSGPLMPIDEVEHILPMVPPGGSNTVPVDHPDEGLAQSC